MGPVFVYVSFVVICAGALVRPSIGIIGYIFYVALVPRWLWGYGLHDPTFGFQKYIAIATLIGFALSGFQGAKFNRTAAWSVSALCFFLAVSYVSALQSIEPERSWYFMSVIYKIVLMTFMTVKLVHSRKNLLAAVYAIIIGVGWNAYEINMDYFRRGYSTINADGWAYQNANGFALILVLVAIVTIVVAIHNKSVFIRAFLLVVALLDIHAIYIVESRGGMLGLIASAVLLLVLMEKNRQNFTLLGLAGAAALALAGPSVTREFESSFARQLDASAESRFYIWAAGARLTVDYPLLGVGPWAAETLVPQYYNDPGIALRRDRVHLHNLPLEVSTGMGVPALIAYCVFFFLPLTVIYKILRQKKCDEEDFAERDEAVFHMMAIAALCAMPGYWVASFFNSGALLEVPYVVAALTLAAVHIYDSAKIREKEGFDPLVA